MARLIVKSPYIKCGGGQGAGGYMKYIATRERVEIIPDDRPPTRKQEQLITKLVNDFPDTKGLLEYEDYTTRPTKANASSLITLALEENWSQVQSSEGYAKYIATRPRAERLGDHGLFGDEDSVDLDKAMSELEHYTGNVWTHIISLHREDAERLGYNNAQAWRSLLRTHRNDIAAAMKIPPQDFRWYAAFHDEGKHPHVHMMAWSVKPGQAYLSKDGIRQIKSTLTNQIFQQEMLHLYEQKSESRDELVRETRRVMLELSHKMGESVCEHPQAEQMISNLARRLGEVKGKKSYYTFPAIKADTATRLVLKKPKTDSSIRKIWLPKTLAYILREWKQSQDKVKELVGEEYQDHNLVLAQANGRPYEDRLIEKAFNQLKEKAGLPNVVFHSLRHSSTTYKLKLNHGDLKATQGDTGHAQIDMITQVYAHILDEDRKINAQKFEAAFYANPDLRAVRPPEGSKEPAPAALNLESLVEQLRQSPELAGVLASLLAGENKHAT